MTRAAARTNTVSTSGGGGGGTVNDGVLQIQGGVPLSSSLTSLTDQLDNVLPISISDTEIRFDVNVGIGQPPSAGYGLIVSNILTNNLHLSSFGNFLASYDVLGVGVFVPTGGKFGVNINGTPNEYFTTTETRSWVRTYLDFGNGSVDANRPAVGPSLTHGSYIQNGEYLRFQSGHNPDWVNANYYFNVPTRTFSSASPTGTVASIIEIPNHTFSITNDASRDINYRGLSIAYTINNTSAATATGVASGVHIDSNITNANGMLHRGFYYGISGAGVTSNTQHTGIELENTVAATSGNQQHSPYIVFRGNGWKTNATAESWPLRIRMGIAPVQHTTIARNIFTIDGSTNNGAYTAYMTLGPDNFGQVNLTIGGSLISSGVANTGTVSSNSTNGASTSPVFNAIGAVRSHASGDFNIFTTNIGASNTSGNGTTNAFVYNATINQTGTATGIVRGVWINPTLTSAVDFRAYEALFTFNAPASSSHTFRGVNLNYTINNGVSQSGTSFGIFLNATETALNGMSHRLLEFQVGGSPRFRVENSGNVTVYGQLNANQDIMMGNTVLYWSGGYQLRNTTNGIVITGASGAATGALGLGMSSGTGINAACVLDIASTTKGVRFPNMTTTQKNAISTPPAGLVVYDTDLGKLCVYTTAWQTITSS